MEDIAFVVKDDQIIAVRGVSLGVEGDALKFRFNDQERTIAVRRPPAAPQASACAKSAIRSSVSSMPTDTRTSESAMPISARRSAPISQ